MKPIFLLFILFFSTQITNSQNNKPQVLASSGKILSNSEITINFTVGELITTSLTNGTTTINQGFHQGQILFLLKLNPTIFLQGPIATPTVTGLMNDYLRTNGIIPVSSPYPDGITMETSILNITGNNAIVDWIWIELRDENDKTIIIDSQSALLQRDGDVVGIDGISELSFSQSSGNYYVAVNHRNHLGILSASAISLSSTSTLLDLSSDPSTVFGDTNAVINMGNGIYALNAGDYDEDGQVLNSDIVAILALSGTSGYSKADANMDGQILNTDVTLIVEPNTGKGEQY